MLPFEGGALLLVCTQISVSLFSVFPAPFDQLKLIEPIAAAEADKLLGVAGTASIGALKSSFKILGNLGVDIL